VLRGAQEAVRGLLEVLHADPVVGRQDAARECSHVGVVTGVVLIHQGTEPAVVTLGYSLPWLPFSQLRPLGHHLRQAPQDEVELDRHRLLAPQRAVVVEHATRSSGGTAADPSAPHVRATKSTIARLVGPSRQLDTNSSVTVRLLRSAGKPHSRISIRVASRSRSM
jgi:hypothetical protein